jgi:hypothetical protein
MPKMVGWTRGYGGQRVSPARSLYPSPVFVGRRGPAPNSFKAMGRVPKRRRRR